MSYIAERNRSHCFPRTISRGVLESTFEHDSTEPVVEFEWGYGVKSDVFPKRYYTVRKVGDLWCGSCRDERIRPRHVQAVLDFIAAKRTPPFIGNVCVNSHERSRNYDVEEQIRWEAMSIDERMAYLSRDRA